MQIFIHSAGGVLFTKGNKRDTHSHSTEGAGVEAMSRLVVKQQTAADVHGIGALAHDDGVFGNVRLYRLEYRKVVQGKGHVA